MARDDWFRNAEWDQEIETKFFEKLKRARDKSQYLKIQSWYLTKKYPQVALRLLDQYFLLSDRSFDTQAYQQKAHAFATLGNLAKSFACYEEALKQELLWPNHLTQAYIEYVCLIVGTRSRELYARGLEILASRCERPAFPIDTYLFHGCRALLFSELGRTEDARSSAALALAAAQKTKSGFRYHQSLGLVKDINDEFGMRVSALAAEQKH